MTVKHRQNLLVIFAAVLILILPGLDGWLWSQVRRELSTAGEQPQAPVIVVVKSRDVPQDH